MDIIYGKFLPTQTNKEMWEIEVYKHYNPRQVKLMPYFVSLVVLNKNASLVVSQQYHRKNK